MRGQSWTASLGLGSGAAAATPAWQLRWTSRAPGTRRSACFRKRPPCSFVTTALLEGRHSPCGPSLSLALPCPSLSFAISLATVDHDCTRRRAQALRADEYYTKVLLDEQSISILPRGPVWGCGCQCTVYASFAHCRTKADAPVTCAVATMPGSQLILAGTYVSREAQHERRRAASLAFPVGLMDAPLVHAA